jgi:hypothetical protein
MPASTTRKRKVDISDRAAAVDRHARLAVILDFLFDLDNMAAAYDPRYPSWGDESDRDETSGSP